MRSGTEGKNQEWGPRYPEGRMNDGREIRGGLCSSTVGRRSIGIMKGSKVGDGSWEPVFSEGQKGVLVKRN